MPRPPFGHLKGLNTIITRDEKMAEWANIILVAATCYGVILIGEIVYLVVHLIRGVRMERRSRLK